MKRTFWSSRAVRAALVQTALWCAYTALPLFVSIGDVRSDTPLDAGILFALSLLLAVRINRAYERWWEGRILWGTLVNASRNLAVKVRTFAQPDADEAARVHALISGFAYGLRDHLREGARLDRLAGFEPDEVADHVPSAVVSRLYGHFREWSVAKRVTQHELRMLDLEGRILLDVAGGCERIRNTSLPPALTWVTRVAVTSAGSRKRSQSSATTIVIDASTPND